MSPYVLRGQDRPNQSLAWLFCAALVVLLFSTVRDILSLHHRLNEINASNQHTSAALRQSGEKAAFIESMRTDLTRLASTDPAAAQLLAELFPSTQKIPADHPSDDEDATAVPRNSDSGPLDR